MDNIRTTQLVKEIEELKKVIAKQESIILQYESDMQTIGVILEAIQKGVH